MTKHNGATEACPIHQACAAVKRSQAVRLVRVAELSTLKALRGMVDRRLGQLEDRMAPTQGKAARIAVCSEPPPDE